MNKRTKFLVGGLIGLALTLTGCGHKTITCTNPTGVSLVKHIFYHSDFEPVAMNTIFGKIYSFDSESDIKEVKNYCEGNTSEVNSFDLPWIKRAFNPALCQAYLKFYNKLESYDIDEVVQLKDIFTDKVDKQSNTVLCHGTFYMQNPNNKNFSKIGELHYQLQLSTNGDEVEATLYNQ